MAENTFVVCTGNQNKLQEIRQVLPQCEILSILDKRFSRAPVFPEEVGLSFLENALAKARFGAEHTHLPSLADDSGLLVDALKGAPGIYSARYAGNGANDLLNCQKLLKELEGVDPLQRTASFYCALVFVKYPQDPAPLIAEGSWSGYINNTMCGENGFGYDPLFRPNEYPDKTAAQLLPQEKNAVSHRGRALQALAKRLRISHASI